MDQTLTISVSMMAIVIILRCPVGDLNSLVNVGWGIMANDVRKSPLVFRFKCVSIDFGAVGGIRRKEWGFTWKIYGGGNSLMNPDKF